MHEREDGGVNIMNIVVLNIRTSDAFLPSRSLTRSIRYRLRDNHYGRSRSGWSAYTPQIDLKFIF